MPIVCLSPGQADYRIRIYYKMETGQGQLNWHNYREHCRKHSLGTEVYDENSKNFSQNIIDNLT